MLRLLALVEPWFVGNWLTCLFIGSADLIPYLVKGVFASLLVGSNHFPFFHFCAL